MSRTLLILGVASASLVAALVSSFIWRAPAKAQATFDFAKEATPWSAAMNDIHACKAEKLAYASLAGPELSCEPSGIGIVTTAGDAQFMYFCAADGRIYRKSDEGLRRYRTKCTIGRRGEQSWKLYANYLQCRRLTGAPPEDIAGQLTGTAYSQELVYCPRDIEPDATTDSGRYTILHQCFQRTLESVRKAAGDPTLRPCPPNTDWKSFDQQIVQGLGLVSLR